MRSEDDLFQMHLFTKAYKALNAHAAALGRSMEEVRVSLQALAEAMEELAPYLHEIEEPDEEDNVVILHPMMVEHPSFNRKN